MKILLINNNPVVSRLTALSARKEDVEIDEIQEVTELNSDHYDIVFVDAESWSKDVNDVISENIKTQKTVLFYADGEEEEKKYFDIAILKPFLPSEVSAVIRSVETSSKQLNGDESHFDVLEDAKANKSNEKFDLEGLDALEDKKEEVALSLEEKEASFDEKLEEAFPLEKKSLDDDLFDLDLKEETLSLDNELFVEDKDKKEKSFDLEEDTLEIMDISKKEELSDVSLEEDLPLELDEVLEKETKEEVSKVEEKKTEVASKETKILDASEIENIKGILTEDTNEEMTLEDLMTPPMAVMPSAVESTTKEEKSTQKEEKQKVKVEKKSDDEVNFDTNVLAQTLLTMPVENLRELLAGAQVNIKIKFPKSQS